MHSLKKVLFLVLAAIATPVMAADAERGPVIQAYGPVYSVPQGSFNLDPDQDYKVIMDIGKGPEDPAAVDRGIESVARFLNMHARNGISSDKLEFALVLHGSAARAVLTDAAYKERFGTPNSNKPLLEELGQAGVAVYLCGQTAAYRGFEAEQLLPQVTMAVSAMTVHVRLQQEGYRPILF
jgi:intracellular sulfur oxidation DsrE/DsrF family protein